MNRMYPFYPLPGCFDCRERFNPEEFVVSGSTEMKSLVIIVLITTIVIDADVS